MELIYKFFLKYENHIYQIFFYSLLCLTLTDKSLSKFSDSNADLVRRNKRTWIIVPFDKKPFPWSGKGNGPVNQNGWWEYRSCLCPQMPGSDSHRSVRKWIEKTKKDWTTERYYWKASQIRQSSFTHFYFDGSSE